MKRWRTDLLHSKAAVARGAGFVLLAALLFPALFAQRQEGTAGKFDYFLLSLSWAPEFCAQPGEAARSPQECAVNRHIGFIVHGLWPEMNEGTSPESCGAAKSVPGGLANSLMSAMPSRGLIQHEWATHGTCTGMDMSAYFTMLLLARSAVQVPVQISSLTEAARENPAQIEEQFASANPSFPKGGFRVACRNGAMTEVRACFDRNLKPQACRASAGECTATSITMLPPR